MTTQLRASYTWGKLTPMISVRRITLLFPWVAMAIILTFATMAWWQVGHWPYYSHPDPKDVVLGGVEVGLPMSVLIFVSLVTSVLGAAGIAIYHLCVLAKQGWWEDHEANRRARKDLVQYLAGSLCLLGVLGWNISWLLD